VESNVWLSVPLDFDYSGLYKLLLMDDPRPHGFMTPEVVSKMPWSAAPFAIDHDKLTIQVGAPSGKVHPAQACTEALQAVVDVIVATDAFGITHGNHGEACRIMGVQYDGVHPQMERYPAPLFGIALGGVGVTCFVRDPAAPLGLKIWVARRAKHLYTYPSMLDTAVGGCIKAADEPLDSVVAEAQEEAGLDESYVRENVRAAGVVTYISRSRKHGNITPSVVYVYDLELSPEIVPVPTDGEVEAFYLWDVNEVKAAMLRDEFKSNCNLVMLDFFIRHGILTPENEANFIDIATRLRRRLPVPTMP
jgi:8-oxo-dGTP pyrophosphatase MutT (NUDIX family)